jgi:hypothetical protein
LCGLVVPLAGAGALLGLVGLVRVPRGGRARAVPVGAAAAGAAVLLAALLAPGLLGPTYRLSRQRGPADSAAVRVVPLRLRDRGDPALRDPDWVDASKASLQQGRVRVQVLSAAVAPVDPEAARRDDALPPRCLFIRLRVHRAGAGHGGGPPPLGKLRPALADAAGAALRRHEAAETDEPRVVNSDVFPTSYHDEVFAFDAPPPGAKSLRLEVPAAAWGGAGALHFTIPAGMIRQGNQSP